MNMSTDSFWDGFWPPSSLDAPPQLKARTSTDSAAEWQPSAIRDLIAMPIVYLVGVQILIWSTSKWQRLDLKSLKFSYNCCASIFSLWMCYGITCQLWRNLSDAEFDYTLLACDRYWRLREGMEFWFWWFHVSKYIEFTDTAFLILGKKHLAKPRVGWYLQIYHHTITPSIGWHAWVYAVDSSFMGVITNTGVHFIMYGYFALVAVVPSARRYGKYVTSLQLLQFAFCLCYAFVSLYGAVRCSGSFYSWCFIQAVYVSMLLFFLAFDKARKQKVKASKTS